MRRELTNKIRFIMDECLPPIIRDSRWFMRPFFRLAYHGRDIDSIMDFKQRVGQMSQEEYDAFYRGLRSMSRDRETDLTSSCLEAILSSIPADARSVADVGCGHGFLLRKLRSRRPDIELVGLDILDEFPSIPGVKFVSSRATELPLDDKSVDVTICTHVLEHLPQPARAVEELLRITRKKLLIVVPCQRAFRYTLDEHVNFFLYAEALTGLVGLSRFACTKLDGDWYYEGIVE